MSARFTLGAPLFSGSVAINPLATAWAAAVVVNGGSVSLSQLYRVSTLITLLEWGGVWAKRDDMWITSAESAIQACTSLKRLVLATEVNSPIFVAKRGYFFNGTDNYLNTGFIPTTHGATMSNSDAQISVWELSNEASAGTTAGTFQDANRALYILPRSGGGTLQAQINSNLYSGPTVTDSSSLFSMWRSGGTWGAYGAGQSLSVTQPSFNGNSESSIAMYIGANNRNGVAGDFRACAVGWVSVGAFLTLAQEKAQYDAVNNYFQSIGAFGPFDIYASSVSANGIPIGSNTTGVGTSGAPYLTWDKAYASSPAGSTIFLNGDPLSPPTYQSGTNTLIGKSLTVTGVVPHCAILAGKGATTAIEINPAVTGSSITLKDIIVDPSANTTTAGARSILLDAPAFNYALTLDNVKFQGAGTGPQITSFGSDLNIDLLIDGCEATLDTCEGFVDIIVLAAGGVEIRDTTCVITNQTTAGKGAYRIHASAAGCYASIVDCDASVTLDPTLTSTGAHVATRIQGIDDALIDGGTHEVLGAPGSRTAYVAGITSGTAGVLTANRGIVRNLTARNETNGGICAYIGGEEGAAARQQDMEMHDVDAFGNATSQAGGVHGLMNGNTLRGYVHDCTWETVGLAVVDKRSEDSTIEDIDGSDFGNTAYLAKGAENFLHCRISATAVAGNSGGRFHYTYADDDPAFISSGRMTEGAFTNDGGTGMIMRQLWINGVDDGSTETADLNDYHETSGSLDADIWRIGADDYTAFGGPTGYQAEQEPTATSNVP